MEQYIPKEALVAEIEKLELCTMDEHMNFYSAEAQGEYNALSKLESFIDTLEVKEVDLQEGPKTEWLKELQKRLDSLSKEDFEKVMAKYRRYGEEGTVDYDKLNTMLDESLSTETKESWNKRLGEEPASEDLDKEMDNYLASVFNKDMDGGNPRFTTWFKALRKTAIHFANLQKENLWKPADGDDLPEIDREVIALLDNGKVVYAHRPPEYWDGKNIVTGKVTRHYPKTYGKGGWNIPDVKYWLDCLMPKEIEL